MNKKTVLYKSFIFTHIPKCAGTSFRKYLYSMSVQNGIKNRYIYIPGTFDIPHNKNLNQLSEKELDALKKKSIKVLANHSKFNEHLNFNLNLKNPFYYTILREPVSRFISHYNFFYFKHGDEKHQNVPLNELPEEELTTILKSLSNLETIYLANIKFFRSFGLENVLKVAKYNLEYEYSCFGVVEKIEESINMLKDNLPAWLSPNETDFPRMNSNKKVATDLQPRVLEKIKAYNKFDIELYNFALRIFEERAGKKN